MLYVVRRTGWDLGFLGLFLRLVFRRSSQLQGLSRSSQGEGKKGKGYKKKKKHSTRGGAVVGITYLPLLEHHSMVIHLTSPNDKHRPSLQTHGCGIASDGNATSLPIDPASGLLLMLLFPCLLSSQARPSFGVDASC